MRKLKFLIFALSFCILMFGVWYCCTFAQEGDLEFTLDVNSHTIPLPKVFRPNIDLSGRGFHYQAGWPQELAANEILEKWQKDIGFSGIYRLQYNLWDIADAAKDKDLQIKMLSNYENIIKNITEAGGLVILNIFGTPPGLGKVLDKKSPPENLKAFKSLVKSIIRNLSCDKRYNIWYEVWTAPDLDNFFLGRRQEYLALYKITAQAIKELEAETKINIRIGGPSSSWWFQDFNGNSIITPERSLIYDLIRFCYGNHLPLDFVTWHAYSTDPACEKEATTYNKTAAALIRDWLSYFHFDRDIPLIVDEWNFDSGSNVSPQRGKEAHISASYIPARLKNMYEAGLDRQLFFSLEDFNNNKEGVVRDTGIFWFDPEARKYKGGNKSTYNVFRMLENLGNNLFLSAPKPEDDFVGIIATKAKDKYSIIIYNYIDPQLALNYISRNLAMLSSSERRGLLNLIKDDSFSKILSRQIDIVSLRLTKKSKNILKKALELNDKANKFISEARNIKINIKNLKENYTYQRYAVNSLCSLNCEFIPLEEKEISASDPYQETLILTPYSVTEIVLKVKPAQIQPPVVASEEKPKPNKEEIKEEKKEEKKE